MSKHNAPFDNVEGLGNLNDEELEELFSKYPNRCGILR